MAAFQIGPARRGLSLAGASAGLCAPEAWQFVLLPPRLGSIQSRSAVTAPKPTTAGSRGGRVFLPPSSPGDLVHIAHLWRRSGQTRSISAACRCTHRSRQPQSGLPRCLPDNLPRRLADVSQTSLRHRPLRVVGQQSSTRSVGNVRNLVGEVRNVSC